MSLRLTKGHENITMVYFRSKIVFTPSARDQFLRGLAYIRRDKPSAAVSFRWKAEQVL